MILTLPYPLLPAIAVLTLALASWFLPPTWVNHSLPRSRNSAPPQTTGELPSMLRFSWGSTLLMSALVGLGGVALFDVIMPEQTPVVLGHVITTAGGILAFMAAMTAITDYTLYKIPKRVTQVASVLGLGLVAWVTIATGSFMALFVALGCLVIPFILMFTRGIGMGDIRLYGLTAILLPWWMGIQMYVYGLIAGVVVGLLSFAVARVLHVGAQREMKPGIIDKLVYRVKGKKLPDRITKRVLPFGPAILIGFTVAAVWVVAVGEPVACADYFYTCVAPM